MKPLLIALFVLSAPCVGAVSPGAQTPARHAGSEDSLLRRSCAAAPRTAAAQACCGACPAGTGRPAVEAALSAHYALFHRTGDAAALARAWACMEQVRAAGGDHATAPPAMEQVQNKLQEGEGWLSYFVGERDIYALLLRRDACRLVRIRKDFPLDQWVHDFRSAIIEYPLDRRDSLVRAFRERGWALYQKLLAPLGNDLPYRVAIAADGVLHHLPFEILPCADPGGCALPECPYLLRRHSISYAPSASLRLAPPPNRNGTVKHKILAFAPEFSKGPLTAGRSGRPVPLPHNKAEVSSIARYFPVKPFTGREATKARFQACAPGYRGIHLATHARANEKEGDSSYLYFSGDAGGENRLFARELLPSSLQADLVVLSACESGIGELRGSEGMVGLGSAFLRAGARSVVASLWRINDRQAAGLMDRFYAGLRRGLPKDEALRQAKLDYLSGQRSPFTHPFFWAAFVAHGDMSPLDLPKPVPSWAWVVGLGLGAAACGYGSARVARRRHQPQRV